MLPADCFILWSIGRSVMGIVVAIVGGIIILCCVGAGFICYSRYTLSKRQPLSIQDLELCRELVEARLGYPWICRRTLRTGECAYFPCPKLAAARGLLLQR